MNVLTVATLRQDNRQTRLAVCYIWGGGGPHTPTPLVEIPIEPVGDISGIGLVRLSFRLKV